MPPNIRKATPEDAPHLERVVDMASEGLVPAIWSEMAPEGMDGSAVGRALITAEDGDFSYRNALIVEHDGAVAGGLIGNPLPLTPEPIGQDVPEVFVPVKELENLVPGYWYINVVAVDPHCRGQGLGAALLNAAERRARDSRCPGLALVVAASNATAIRAYEPTGYRERARRPFDLSGFGVEPTDALLMVKELG